MDKRSVGQQRRGATLVSAIAMLVFVAGFAAVCLSVHLGSVTIEQHNAQRVRAAAAAQGGAQLALWRLANDADLQESLARAKVEGDTSFGADALIAIDGALLGAAFTVDVWPGEDTVRLHSRAAAGDVHYDRWAQMPMTLGQARMEAGVVTANRNPRRVLLQNTYSSPVVVCSVQYNSNKRPVVPRVRNVTADSFDLRLVNPGGANVSGDKVHYIVMEEGAWTFGGLKCEAQRYDSVRTDHRGSWVGTLRSYTQSYTSPVVVGQVMTENDADFSTFWCRSNGNNPPTRTLLRTGKTVCEDYDKTRATETVGHIVFETGRGAINGAEFRAFLGPRTIRGVQGSPPYLYTLSPSFSATPQVVIVNMAGVRGGNGGWAQLHGPSGATTSRLYLSIDEDQIRDSERAHTTEQVGCVVFETPVVYP